MPSFSTNIRKNPANASCPIVPVFIGDASQVDGKIEEGHQGQVQVGQYTGLLDTGASVTCITRQVAEQMKIRALGTRPMSTASHQVDTTIYRLFVVIAIDLPQEKIKPSKDEKLKYVPMSVPTVVEACEFVNHSGDVPAIDVLIGMDIIMTSVMIINGHDNRLTMSF